MPDEQRARISAALKARGQGQSATKRCPQCQKTKPRSAFGVRKNGYSRAHCRECELTGVRRWRERNPAKVIASNAVGALRPFSLTTADWEKMLADQRGGCAICGRPRGDNKRRLYVDHCHATGRVRGLLCANCNTGLGMFGDDPDLLFRAIEYVTRTPHPDDRYVVTQR